MKKVLKNTNIPYHTYDKKDICSCYIYNNKKYYDLNLLFNDYIASYLTYHFKISNKLITVHNLNEVAIFLLENYKTFSIPDNYIIEYSKSEYEYFIKLQNHLLKNQLNRERLNHKKMKFKYILKYPKDYLVSLEIKKYKDTNIPKKIYSKILKREIYVLYGNFYNDIFYSLYYIFNGSFYYQFNKDGIEDNSNHSHSHYFEEVIDKVIKYFDEFKIYDYQKQFYSKQELDFINKLLKKLKQDKFTSIHYKNYYDYFDKTYEEYKLIPNKTRLKLFIFNIKDYFKSKKLEKEIIKSHKTKI